jgi:FAD/FMN-containing dehydrogenase
VLGVEAVLASGEVWNGLRTLRKDNTGYDLKDLFVGGEGTLGIITAAVLKLFPKPRGVSAAFVGLRSPADALKLLKLAKSAAGPALTGFELIPRIGIEFVLRHLPGARDPLAAPHAWYVLFEISSQSSQEQAEAVIETIFAEAFEADIVEDGMRAESVAQAAALWALREALSDAQKPEGGSIKHDVSVPVAAVPELIERGVAAVKKLMPDIRPVPFGHVGDGNIHFNFSQPVGMDKQAFIDRWDDVNSAVHAIVAELGGSISAEHGIGRLKRKLLVKVKSPLEIALMKRIKATLDPNGIMNPGVVI